MKYLGIDYGTKRIGVALTDEEGKMAFPKAVLPNDRYLMQSLGELLEGTRVQKVIIGESLNRKGEENEIMQDIRRLAAQIERTFNIPVDFEPEMYTSEEAKRLQTDDLKKNKLIDASAAAIILNSYIVRQSNKKTL